MVKRFSVMFILTILVAIAHSAAVAEAGDKAGSPEPVFKHSDVVFMYASDEAAYKAYGATFVAWGGANSKERVKMHHDLGIRCTGSMWCLTAGAKTLYENAELREAVARDIEGKPIEVSWLFDHTYKDMKTYFGCTNHPAFREHSRQQVRQAMAGGADGLHIDDHLGVAQAATAFGGGLCDYCVAGFREYLKKHATREQLAETGVKELENFDYRDVIRKVAKTRDEYMKVQSKIPLIDLFRQYHLEAVADFVRELHKVGEEAAGHPILLSANACLPERRHVVVVKYLTHVVCEVSFNARQGTAKPDDAIAAFEMARSLGKPMAATASGWDWSHIKAKNVEELVRFWIALTYAHGQWFMVPHPQRQWCFNNELGTHWYQAPIEAFAPVYQFIRKNAQWFDGFEPIDASEIKTPANVLCTARRKGESGPIVLHVLNRDYDAEADRMRSAKDVRVSFPKNMLEGLSGSARLLSYDGDGEDARIETDGDTASVTIPELRLWMLVVIE
ncbi:MAG: hypothetical protein Q8Q12_01685 [bacterium]|nr:hypothetical protein [bacterium]